MDPVVRKLKLRYIMSIVLPIVAFVAGGFLFAGLATPLIVAAHPPASSIATPVVQASPGLTPEDIELQQLLMKVDTLDADVRSDEAQAGNQRLLDAALPASAALVVGLLAWFGVTRQTGEAKDASRKDLRQRVLLDRWSKAVEVMQGFEGAITDATLRMNALREERLTVGPTGRDPNVDELAHAAQRSAYTVSTLSGRLSAVGVDAGLFETYSAKAAHFITSAEQGKDVATVEEAFQEFRTVNDALTRALAAVGASLSTRIGKFEADLGVS